MSIQDLLNEDLDALQTKVQILDTVNNWKKIKLSDGKTGWIINDDLKAL